MWVEREGRGQTLFPPPMSIPGANYASMQKFSALGKHGSYVRPGGGWVKNYSF